MQTLRAASHFFYRSLSGLLFSFYKDALTILCTAASLNSLLSARPSLPPSLLVLLIHWKKKPINTDYTAAIMEHFVYFGKRRNLGEKFLCIVFLVVNETREGTNMTVAVA